MKRLRPEFLGFDSIEVVKVPAPTSKLTEIESQDLDWRDTRAVLRDSKGART